MAKKIILDLCGGTGAWSRPYLEAGYYVHVLTLPQYDVTNVYMGPSNLPSFDGAQIIAFRGTDPEIGDLAFRADQIHGILAAPPCTEFSRAKTTAPRDYAKGMETVRACLEIIWHCQIHGKLVFWALENPDGYLYRFLGRPPFKFEQWQFGGEIEKPTCLWGTFRPPVPTVTEKPAIDKYVQHSERKRVNHNSKFYACPPMPEEYREYLQQFPDYMSRRAAARAITPAGFAQAFFKANR